MSIWLKLRELECAELAIVVDQITHFWLVQLVFHGSFAFASFYEFGALAIQWNNQVSFTYHVAVEYLQLLIEGFLELFLRLIE